MIATQMFPMVVSVKDHPKYSCHVNVSCYTEVLEGRDSAPAHLMFILLVLKKLNSATTCGQTFT